MASPSKYRKHEPILVVGAGVFGLGTALELAKRGYTHVTVLDRYNVPVPDGSSVDISRIIRVEYGDAVYARMAREAVEGWNGAYKKSFYRAGYVMLGERAGNMAYFDKAQAVNRQLGDENGRVVDGKGLRAMFRNFPTDMTGLAAFVNPADGWADAEAAIQHLGQECSQHGVSFVTGPRGRVTSLRMKGGKVVGVNVAQGEPVLASQVVLATGAWTNRLLPMSHASSASGQAVGFVQLTEAEAAELKDMPVIHNLSTGLFVFPPYPGTNVLKVVRHGHGFASRVAVDGDGGGCSRVVSSPNLESNNAASGYLPDDASEGLREGLRQLVPRFADRPWLTRRMCWYSDTPDGDFIVDRHPQIDGLFLATGGAGHAFKFLPVLGRYVADCFEGKASAELRHKWRFRLPDGSGEGPKSGDGSRGGPPLRTLRPEEQAKL